MSLGLSWKTQELRAKYHNASAEEMLRGFLREEFPGKIALVSSFGIEAAPLLALTAKIDPATPVIFLDTHKLFPETLSYRDQLIERLGLENVRTQHPDYIDVQRDDPEGDLWQRKPDHCCFIRKVKTLNKALKGYDAWITGRKRFHGGLRSALPAVEYFDGRIKLNPLSNWAHEDVKRAFAEFDLPPHPLEAAGYSSVGCTHCTAPPAADGDVRSGRWAGQQKSECGIHVAADGRLVRSGAEE